MPLRGWLSLPWCLGAVVPAPPWPSPKQFQLSHPIAVDGPGLPCLPTPTLENAHALAQASGSVSSSFAHPNRESISMRSPKVSFFAYFGLLA